MPACAQVVQFQPEQEVREEEIIEGAGAVQMMCADCEAELEERQEEESEEVIQQKLGTDGAVIPPPDDNDDYVAQLKCARCENGGTPNHEGDVQAKNTQSAPAPVNARGSNDGRSILSQARQGLRNASNPLPHQRRIQASFGHHDISGVRTETGGAAGRTSERMGALAFTSGNRIGFRADPDLHLAAHEAAHVVQQRRGVSLKNTVGSPGDPYEQQADAAADRVVNGGSAEELLDDPNFHGGDTATAQRNTDAAKGNSQAEDDKPLQMALEVSSRRLFEEDTGGAGNETEGGEGGAGEAGEETGGQAESESELPAGDGETEANGEAEENGEAETEDADSESASAEGGSSGSGGGGGGAGSGSAPAPAPRESSPAGGGGGSASPASNSATPAATSTPAVTEAGEGAGVGGAPSGESCTPECYEGPREQPTTEPSSRPADPPRGEVEAEASEGDEEELPEVDNCHNNEAEAAGSAASQATETATAMESGPAGTETAAGQGAESAGGEGASGGESAVAGSGAGGPGAAASESGMAEASPIEAVIASAEAQRAISVAAYADSSAALNGASTSATMLRNGVRFNVPNGEDALQQRQRREAASRADAFFASVADRLDEAIRYSLNDIPDQLGAVAESAKAQIGSSMEQQKSAISGRIERARGVARADAALARAAIREQAAAYIADIESATAEAIDTLTATHAETMASVDELETSTLDQLNEIYAQGRTDLEGLGTTIGDECTAKGMEFATQYEGFRSCTEDGFWDGNLAERRANAQAEAAYEVAGRYYDRMVDGARKRAREVTRNGRKTDRCAVIAAAGRSRDTIDEQLPALTGALESARDSAIQQAGVTETNLLGSIDSALNSTLGQLDQQERTQRQAVNDTGYMQQVLQEQIAHGAAAAVQQGVKTAFGSVQQSMRVVQARFAANYAPDPETLGSLLASVEQRVNTAMEGLHTSADTGAANAEVQLADALQQAISSLQGITQSNDEQAGTLSSGFTSAMSNIAGTDNFATQRATVTAQIDQATASGNDALRQALDGLQQTCDEKTASAATKLDEAQASLEQNLRQGKRSLECEMTRKADEAAAKERPAWKTALAVVLVIIVIIIVIAVTVVTAGAAGPVIVAALGGPIMAGIIIGAAVGAVTSALLAMASDLWNNRDINWGNVGKAALIGLVTGAIGGGIGAAAGAGAGALFSGASRAVQTAAQFGAAMISASGFDVVTQFVMGGFSFDDFSWGQLGLTFLITAVTFGIGHVAATRATANAPRPTDAPEPTPVPTPTETPEPTIGFGRTPRTPTTSTPEPTIGFGRTPRTPATPTPEPTIGFGRTPRTPTTPTPEPTIGFGRTPRAPTTPTPESTIGFGRTPRGPGAALPAGGGGVPSAPVGPVGRSGGVVHSSEPHIVGGRPGSPGRSPIMAGGSDPNAPVMSGNRRLPGGPANVPEPPTTRPIDTPEPPSPRPVDTPEPTTTRPVDTPEPPTTRPVDMPEPPSPRPVDTPEPTTARPSDTPESPTSRPTDTSEPSSRPTDTPEPSSKPTDTPEQTGRPTDTPEFDARLRAARDLSDAELNTRIKDTPKTNDPTDESNVLRFERYRRGGGTNEDYDSWFGGSRGGRPGSPEHQADVAANNGPPNNLEPQVVGDRVPDGVGEPGQTVVIRGQEIQPQGNGRVIVESDHVVHNGTMPNSEARAQMRGIRAADPDATLVVTDLSNPSAPPLVYPPGTQPPPPGHLPPGQAPIIPYP